MTPHQVQLLSGTALNILRQILIGQKHVSLISQWYGETVGFWNGETLVAWTDHVQGWSMSHALPEFSSELEAIEVFTRDEQRNLHLEITIYDPVAFVASAAPRGDLHAILEGPESEMRYQWKECQQALWNVNGRLQPVAPGTVIDYRVPDWYRPAVGEDLGGILRGGHAAARARREYFRVRVSAHGTALHRHRRSDRRPPSALQASAPASQP